MQQCRDLEGRQVTRGVKERSITELLLDQAQGSHAVVPILKSGPIK